MAINIVSVQECQVYRFAMHLTNRKTKTKNCLLSEGSVCCSSTTTSNKYCAKEQQSSGKNLFAAASIRRPLLRPLLDPRRPPFSQHRQLGAHGESRGHSHVGGPVSPLGVPSPFLSRVHPNGPPSPLFLLSGAALATDAAVMYFHLF